MTVTEQDERRTAFIDQLYILEKSIRRVFKETGFIEEGGLVGEVLCEPIDTDSCTPDNVQEWRGYNKAFCDIWDALRDIQYLQKPIRTEGTIAREGTGGRLSLNGLDLPCGSVVDILVDSSTRAGKEWKKTAIEATSRGFYFTECPQETVIGHIARLRG